MESSLMTVASVNEMMLQSYDDEIHVFPAVPDAWKEVSYKNLRTEGAFLVTAKRVQGKTVYMKITSLAGGSFKLSIGSSGSVYRIGKTPGTKAVKGNDGTWNIAIPKGKSIEFFSSGLKADTLIEPITPQTDKLNFYGLH